MQIYSKIFTLSFYGQKRGKCFKFFLHLCSKLGTIPMSTFSMLGSLHIQQMHIYLTPSFQKLKEKKSVFFRIFIYYCPKLYYYATSKHPKILNLNFHSLFLLRLCISNSIELQWGQKLLETIRVNGVRPMLELGLRTLCSLFDKAFSQALKPSIYPFFYPILMRSFGGGIQSHGVPSIVECPQYFYFVSFSINNYIIIYLSRLPSSHSSVCVYKRENLILGW